MTRFTKKIINHKFLYTLPIACLAILCTTKTTNASFRNPNLNMPLMPTQDGKIVFFPPIRPPAKVKTQTTGNPYTKTISTTSTTSTTSTLTTTTPTSISSKNIGTPV